MSGLDHLRDRAAEAEALCRILAGDAGRIVAQRLAIWTAAIDAVAPDYEPVEAEGFEEQEDLDPGPSEEDLAVAAEAVALFEGAVESFTPRDQPPADAADPPPIAAGMDYAGPGAAEFLEDPEPPAAPVAAPPAGARCENQAKPGPNGKWPKERIEEGARLYASGASIPTIRKALNRIAAAGGTLDTDKAVTAAIYRFGWKRGSPPPKAAPVPPKVAPAEDDTLSAEDIEAAKAAIRGGMRAKAIAWKFDMELEQAQDLCAQVDAEAKAA